MVSVICGAVAAFLGSALVTWLVLDMAGVRPAVAKPVVVIVAAILCVAFTRWHIAWMERLLKRSADDDPRP